MLRIDILRHQHDAALDMAQRLLDLIYAYRPGNSAVPILMQLNRLHGILRVHLAQEDVQLYPALVDSPDPQIARVAQRFVDEMGGLAFDLESFAKHWSCSASITGNFQEFSEDAQRLLLALTVRIERENKYLYPLAEEIAGASSRKAA